MADTDEVHTGRCYCGASTVSAPGAPLVVSYCHCEDCRRVTGAPVGAFAAWAPGNLTLTPSDLGTISVAKGVERWFCPKCGSPLAARWDYLPDQIYVPVGVMDRPEVLEPSRHAHAAERLPWLHLADELPRAERSARDGLNAAAAGCDG